MNTFPTIDTAPKISGWSDEYSDSAVEIASFDSGYPCINEMFTFDPRTLGITLEYVSQTDKETVMVFYQANKGVPFYFLNEQESVIWEMIFIGKPSCNIVDNDHNEKWNISFPVMQTASTELPNEFTSRKFYGGDAMIEVENLAAGSDIANRPVYAAGQAMTIVSAVMLTKGTPVGVDDSNTVVLTLKDDSGNTVVTKTFNTATQPPTNDALDLTSLLDANYTALALGDHLTLTVTCGATANIPAFNIILGGYYT